MLAGIKVSNIIPTLYSSAGQQSPEESEAAVKCVAQWATVVQSALQDLHKLTQALKQKAKGQRFKEYERLPDQVTARIQRDYTPKLTAFKRAAQLFSQPAPEPSTMQSCLAELHTQGVRSPKGLVVKSDLASCA